MLQSGRGAGCRLFSRPSVTFSKQTKGTMSSRASRIDSPHPAHSCLQLLRCRHWRRGCAVLCRHGASGCDSQLGHEAVCLRLADEVGLDVLVEYALVARQELHVGVGNAFLPNSCPSARQAAAAPIRPPSGQRPGRRAWSRCPSSRGSSHHSYTIKWTLKPDSANTSSPCPCPCPGPCPGPTRPPVFAW